MFGRSSRDDPHELGPSANEIPVAVPVSGLLARTEELAVGLIGMQVYRTGVSFDLAVRLRREQPQGVSIHKLDAMVDAEGENYEKFQVSDSERLLLRVEYADGGTVSNTGARSTWAGSKPPALVWLGTGAGYLTYDQEFWLTPLPPAGPLTFVCSWPAFDIPETRTVIDGDAVAAAGARVQVLWPTG